MDFKTQTGDMKMTIPQGWINITKYKFSMKTLNTSNATGIIVRALLLCAMLYTILISAWFTDDAFISFRHIWNFINGDGITFNFGQRIQGFSHPLWFIILSGITIITYDMLMTSIFVSIIFSMSAFIILQQLEKKLNNKNIFYTPTVFLFFSYAYCDYTTSGLENPLSFFLFGVLLLIIFTKNTFKNRKKIFIIFALLVLNRYDNIIFIIPLATFLIIDNFSLKKEYFIKLSSDLWPSVLIVSLWIAFSIVYFGFPLPNTFYAKLSSGFELKEYFIRGLYYFFDLRFDPASLVIIIFNIIFSIYSKNKKLILLSIGIILYMIYIIYIGGDFMRGRFFSTIIFLSVGQFIVFFSRSSLKFQRNSFFSILVIVLFGTVADVRFPFLSTTDYEGRVRQNTDAILGIGIQDQRGFFYKYFGLLAPNRDWLDIADQTDTKPDRYQVHCGQLGAISLFGKSNLLQSSIDGDYVIDNCALTDPLLSRIPAIKDKFWRIGHNIRKVPTEYGDFSIGNISELPDKNLREISQDIKLVTRGEIFSIERFKAIWRLNTGHYRDIKVEKYSNHTIWIPLTTKSEIVQIQNWEENIDEYARPNLNIFSNVPLLSNGLTLSLNPSFVYEIRVNDELVGTNLKTDENQELHLEFTIPILVDTVKIKAVGISEISENVRWWVFRYRDRIRFISLWPIE